MIELTLKALRNVTKFSNEKVYEKLVDLTLFYRNLKAKIIGK